MKKVVLATGTTSQINTLRLADSMQNDIPLNSPQQITEPIEPFQDKSVSGKGNFAVNIDNAKIQKSKRKVILEVSNGTGVKGIAARSAVYFSEQGRYITSITNEQNFDFKKSIVFYRKGYLQDAFKIALMVPGYQVMKQVESLENPGVSVKLLLGQDLAILHFPEIMAGFTPQQMPNYDQTVTLVGR